MIADISGKKVKIIHDLSKPQGVRSRSANLTIVTQLLDWQPKYCLQETMKELYPWVEAEIMKLES
jgi:nucleoside-diphosphate-sugar epimerase